MKNKNLKVIIVIIFLSTRILTATDKYHYKRDSIDHSYSIFKIDFLSPGINYEYNITDDQSFILNPFISISYGYLMSNFPPYKSNGFFMYMPSFLMEYRYYYNIKKRAERGKNIDFKSANYFGMQLVYYFMEFGKFPDNYKRIETYSKIINKSFGPVWGIQRSIGKYIYWNLNLGIGYRYDHFNKHKLAFIGNNCIGLRIK